MLKSNVCFSGTKQSGSLWDTSCSRSLLSPAALPGLLTLTLCVFPAPSQIPLPKLFSSSSLLALLSWLCLSRLLPHPPSDSSPFIRLACLLPHLLLFLSIPHTPPGRRPSPPSPPPSHPTPRLPSPPLFFFLQTESQLELSKQMRGVWDHLNSHK